MRPPVQLREDYDAPDLRALAKASGGMAPVRQARRAVQHHPLAIAAKMPGVEPGREPLAIPARQLGLQPGLPLLSRHPRHCCHAWNKLVDQPWTIMSIGFREWAYGF
jgi:hypothetical protein